MPRKTSILIVDDEKAIRYFLSEELSQAGYAVQTATSGEEALAIVEGSRVDLILLDLKMAGMDGLQVMEEIEKQPLSPEVIILTAHPSFDSAVDAMRMGGCDYLRKPCDTEELLGSVAKALAKRSRALEQQQLLQLIEETARQLQPASESEAPSSDTRPRFLEGWGLLLDRELKVVTICGKPLSLTPTEFRLLHRLMEQPGQFVAYQELASMLHGHHGGEWDERDARQALSTHLWRLRRKLGRAPHGIPYVKNVRGRGYRFIGRRETDDAS